MSAEPIDVQILDALMLRLTTEALTDPATPIASPLVDYEPTPGTAFFEAHPIMRAANEQPWVEPDSQTVHRGIFQVDAVAPYNAGEGPGLRLASLVVARFPYATLIDLETTRLKITRKPTIAAAINDAPWVRFPVSIPYIVIA